MLFTVALTKRFADRGVTSTVVQPEIIPTTGSAAHLPMDEIPALP
jgi:hypothetical protein